MRTALAIASLLAATPAFAGTWSREERAGLDVRVFVPDAAGPRGLLVHLHGCTMTNADFEARGNFEGAAEAHGVVVALPQVKDGGVVAGCWDYYGPAHDRTSRHDDDVLALVGDLLSDPALLVDPDRVYVSGLSSGGGQAWVLACLAPDVFAGAALSAAPALGTTTVTPASAGTTAGEAAALCASLAGEAAVHLSTQVVSIVIGDGDTVVSWEAAEVAARSFAQVYGSEEERAFDVEELPGYEPRGVGIALSDQAGPRVQWILAEGLGHAWPAGTGPGAEVGFIASEGLAYPDVLLAFLEGNNRRIEGAPAGDPPRDEGQGPTLGAACACAAPPSARDLPEVALLLLAVGALLPRRGRR